jgi:hypothetical protein
MNETRMPALDASDPLGFLAALGVLRIVSRDDTAARLRWLQDGSWSAAVSTTEPLDLVEVIFADLERWRLGHPAVEFAVNADRKIQDLKHPPEDFRALMLRLAQEPESAEFAASYATGVAVDGSGQTKPTSFHFTAGQQRFMDAVLDLRAGVSREDLEEALYGPWIGRVGPKDMRWKAASDRSRALLSFDPSKEKSSTVAGAAWLAFHAMPHFPVVPVGLRAITTGFTGRGKNEQFTWPVWSAPLNVCEVRVLLGLADLARIGAWERKRRGITQIFRSEVSRNPQGYGNFTASQPV